VSSHPHYDIFHECYAMLDAMIGRINEKLKHFVSEMRKCGLLHGTDPSLSFPRLESSLYDDYESSFVLWSNLVDGTPSTNQEEAFDPPLTSLSVITPLSASTPIVIVEFRST